MLGTSIFERNRQSQSTLFFNVFPLQIITIFYYSQINVIAVADDNTVDREYLLPLDVLFMDNTMMYDRDSTIS